MDDTNKTDISVDDLPLETEKKDIELTCINGHKFIYTVEEQTFFASHTPPWNQPKRCIPCRRENKARLGKRSFGKNFINK